MIRQGKKAFSVTTCNLFSVTCLALLLTPSFAQAQCTPTPTGTPLAPAPASGTIECQPGDYADGINYSSLGDLTLEVQTGSGNLRAFQDGIVVNGTGADNIFFDASDFTGGILNPDAGDAIIDYRTETGDITIVTQTDGRVGGGGSSAARGIWARSGLLTPAVGDGGNINLVVQRSFGRDAPGIEAETDGGDITITGIAGGQIGLENAAGIYAETSGSGLITMDLAGPVEGGGTGPAIHAVGDDDILINTNHVDGSNGIGVVTDTEGVATINASGGITGDTAAIQGIGNRLIANMSSAGPGTTTGAPGIHGGLDFSGLSGWAELHFGANTSWQVSGNFAGIVLSDGDDLVTTAADSTIFQQEMTVTSPVSTHVVDVHFGPGSDTLEHAGTIMVGPLASAAGLPDRDAYPAELRLEGLESFQFSGTVWLGIIFDEFGGGTSISGTDNWRDDILTLPGVDWVGSGNNRIELDVNLNHTAANGQTGCDDSFRGPTGDLPSADCLNLAGGTATGRSFIKINQFVPGDRGAYNPEGIVLVDLSGSNPADTDPHAFGVHPDSQQYSAAQGGIIDKGVFFYTIGFDAENQQFKLYGLPGGSAQQAPLLGHAVNGLWQTATEAWFDRRVDQRDVDLDAGLGGGIWIRSTARERERDVITPIVAGVKTINFDNSYTQDDSVLTFGLDLVSRSAAESSWVFGGMIGYTRSRVEFDAVPNAANFEGVHAGFYGNATFGDFYIDAVLNGAWLDLDNQVPTLELSPDTAELSSDVNSYGGQIEAGWRWNMGRLTVEPLAAISHVTSHFDKVNIPAGNPNRFGAEVELDDPVSSRGSLGIRTRLDGIAPGLVPASVGLTVRVIEEFDGESEVTIASVGPRDARVSNTFDGTFGQIAGDVSVTNAAKTAAGYLKVDGMFGDDYDSLGVSAGFRYQW